MTGGRRFVRYRMWGGGAAALVLALGYAGYLGAQSWFYRAALGRAMSDLSRGDYAAAAPQFAALARRWPGAAEVEYRLGECERALGARTPPSPPGRGSRRAPRMASMPRSPPGGWRWNSAALPRPRRALTGALAVNPAGPKAVDVRQHLIHLFVQQGRYDEAQALLRRQWHELADTRPAEAMAALRAHIVIDLDPTPLTGLRAVLDRAAALAPGDGRVALARANLATREGRLRRRPPRPGRCPSGGAGRHRGRPGPAPMGAGRRPPRRGRVGRGGARGRRAVGRRATRPGRLASGPARRPLQRARGLGAARQRPTRRAPPCSTG